jgi:amino acid adenylation domain-containing protein
MIIRGHNYYPKEIEAAAAGSHSDLGAAAAAFAVRVDNTEQLVIFHELRPNSAAPDVEAVSAAIRRAVARVMLLPVYGVVLVQEGALPRTSLGRVRRYLCCEAFMAILSRPDQASSPPGVLGISLLTQAGEPTAASDSAQPRTAVEQALAEIWREVLPAKNLDVRANFFDMGGDSLIATQMAARARQLFGVELDLISLLENPTVGSMAQQVEAALHQGQTPPAPPITRAGRAGPLPLSFTQEQLWFIHQLDPTNAAYHIAGAVRLRGAFDLPSLEAAFTELVRRHEILRTTFRVVDGEPRQFPAPPAPFHVAVVDLPGADAGSAVQAERLAEAYRLAEQAAREPFNLTQGPLLRATAIRLDADDQVLLLSMHHLISDAWSMSVLGRELTALYRAARLGLPANLPELKIQYADFAVWQRAWLQGEVLERELAYWRHKLAGAAPLELPLDHLRPNTQTYCGAIQVADFDPDVLQALRRFGQQSSATLSMTLLAAFQVLLQRYSRQDDVSVGLPIANRRWLEVEGLIGAFVNTLVLRTDLSGEPSFRELLRRVRQASLEAYAHQDMPFAKLVAELNPERSLNHIPLVQVMFNHLNVPIPDSRYDDVESDDVDLDRGAAQFDLTLTVIDLPPNERLIVEYNTDLFEAGTITRLLRHYLNLLRAIAADPDQSIIALPLLDEGERRQLLVEWNRSERAYPAGGLPELFEEQAAHTPAAPALYAGGLALSFGSLNRRANQIAHYLQTLGAGKGTRVALCLERSFDQVAALLAVLKTGAAYVPLDPAYPPERLRFMLADSQAAVVVTWSQLLPVLGDDPTPARVLALDTEAEHLLAQSDADLGQRVPADAPAYLIYTSGSTGQPKGVVAPHRGAVNRCRWMWEAYPLATGEVACHKTSLSFVDSVAEIFVPLLQGVPLVLIPDEVVKDPPRLVEVLEEHPVTRLVLVPSLLRALLDAQHAGALRQRLPKLALWVVSGEALDPALVEAFQAAFPGATLLNLYGSSEVAGDVTCFDCRSPRPAGTVPIGRPIANTEIYVLDGHQQPVPLGVPGEIFVGGAGLPLGYHNRPELNAERFVPNPFRPTSGARLFRTGDRGRYLADGNLLYLGRRDRQVKLRGVRIELDEIQAALGTHSAVAVCAVSLRERETIAGPQPELVAYYVARPGAAPAVQELRRYLAERLPAAMLPADFIELPALPLLPNGKVDDTALPALSVERSGSAPALVLPRTLLESSLARLWAETLGQPAVGVTDNFFELGGHSLLAASMFERMRSTLGIDLPLTFLFQSPTIADLATAIMRGAQAPERLSSLVPLKPSGNRPPFFCVHPLAGGVGGYAALAHHMHANQPFYGLRAKGLDDEAKQALSLEALAADYVAEIRTLQPSGPYRLGGYSSGGLLAYEMSCQLTEAGEAVSLVALLDSYAPSALGLELWRPGALINFLASLPRWLIDLVQLERQEIVERFQRYWLIARHGHQAVTATDYVGASAMAQMTPRHRAFVEAHYQAILAYRPRPYSSTVTLFRAQAQALSRAADPDKGWRRLAPGGVDIREFRGSHHTMLSEPYVGELAWQLQRKLEELG